MNRVELIGNLVKDPELKFTPGKGTAVTNITLAINDGYGDNKKVYYIPVIVWGKSAEAVANYCVKGSKVSVCGKITTRNYEKDGHKVYITEVVADMINGVEFLTSKGGEHHTETHQAETDDMTPVDDGDIPF